MVKGQRSLKFLRLVRLLPPSIALLPTRIKARTSIATDAGLIVPSKQQIVQIISVLPTASAAASRETGAT